MTEFYRTHKENKIDKVDVNRTQEWGVNIASQAAWLAVFFEVSTYFFYFKTEFTKQIMKLLLSAVASCYLPGMYLHVYHPVCAACVGKKQRVVTCNLLKV